jgi:hypothetical protein
MNIENVLNKIFSNKKEVEEFRNFLFDNCNFEIPKIRKHLKVIIEKTNEEPDILWSYLNWLDDCIRNEIDRLYEFKGFTRRKEVFYDPITQKPEYLKEPDDETLINVIAKLDEIKLFVTGQMESLEQKGTAKNYKKMHTQKYVKSIKFQWNGTEESVLRIVEYLIKAGFVSDGGFKRAAILRDTFLNKEGKPFSNTQLNTKSTQLGQKIYEPIKQNNEDFAKFEKLLEQLKNIMPK